MKNRLRYKVMLVIVLMLFAISVFALIDNSIRGDKNYETKDDKANEFALQIQKSGELLPPDNNEYVKTYSLSKDNYGSLILTITDIDNNVSICEMEPNTYEILDIYPSGNNPETLRMLILICCVGSGGLVIFIFISIIKEKTARK